MANINNAKARYQDAYGELPTYPNDFEWIEMKVREKRKQEKVNPNCVDCNTPLEEDYKITGKLNGDDVKEYTGMFFCDNNQCPGSFRKYQKPLT